MIKTCAVSGKQFEITDEDLKFYAKMGVPVPTLCPAERLKRRMSWRNEMTFHRRKCTLCEKVVISVHSQKTEFPVYCRQCFWGDNWNAFDFGRDFHFNRSFFEQFLDLMKVVPHRNLFITGENENSEYINCAGNSKNCYFLSASGRNEGCMFGNGLSKSVDCMDIYFGDGNELCYELINCSRCYNVKFSQDSIGCSDSWFLKSCTGCKNCFGCVNLQNKEYYFLNEKLSKSDYEKKLKDLKLNSFNSLKDMRANFQKLLLKFPKRCSEIMRSEDCSGDWISDSKNCKESYEVSHSEDCKWCYRSKYLKDSYDIFGYGYYSELFYECVGCGDGKDVMFSYACERSSDVTYSSECSVSRDLFGCYGLKNAQYCILNKQYTKDEYFALRERIIEYMKSTGEWGEFFPAKISPFGYNETVAQEYFPLTKERCLSLGWQWKDDEISTKYQGPQYSIPDLVSEVPSNITEKILECEVCTKNYRIVKPELAFYRKLDIPVPRSCFNCRHKERMKLRNPRTLFDRQCDSCQTNIQTTFSPESPEKVYCEKCYLNEVN